MTCREPQRADDQTAKQLVQLYLPEVEVCLHDDGSEPMMYDLDLWWPDGHAEAMEVTIAIDDDLLRLDLRLVRHGSMIPARESTRDWTLGLASGTTEVRAVKGKADHLLSLVERAGVTRFIARNENESVTAIRMLRRLGVSHGYSFNARREPPKINIVSPGTAGIGSNPSRSARWLRTMPGVTRRSWPCRAAMSGTCLCCSTSRRRRDGMSSWRRANLPRCHSTYPTQLRPYGLLGQWVATGPFMLVRRLSGESAEVAAGEVLL